MIVGFEVGANVEEGGRWQNNEYRKAIAWVEAGAVVPRELYQVKHQSRLPRLTPRVLYQLVRTSARLFRRADGSANPASGR